MDGVQRTVGAGQTAHSKAKTQEKKGVFSRLWRKGLEEYDEMEGIAWSWQSIDGAVVKAPLALETVGPNPTDRGKKWDQAKPSRRRNWNPAVVSRERCSET